MQGSLDSLCMSVFGGDIFALNTFIWSFGGATKGSRLMAAEWGFCYFIVLAVVCGALMD